MSASSPLLWQKAYEALDSKNKAVIPLDFAAKPGKLISEVEKYVSQSQGKPIKLPNGENLFLRDVLQKVARWIKKFVEVGDVAVQYDPGHASLPWALLRLLLQASMNNIDKHAAILEGIEKITYYLVWGRIEEAFLAMPFEAHAQLQLDFIQLYTTILTFVTRSVRFLRNKPQRIATAFFSSDSKFQKDMEQITTTKQSIESHVQQIMDQSSLKRLDEIKGQLADLHQPLIRIEQVSKSTLAAVNRAEIGRILDWTSEISYEKHFRTVHQKALDGTGQWLFQDPEFIAWDTCSRSQILWLHGSAGSGKSTINSVIIHSLIRAHEELQGPYPIYFFCSRNTAEPERADPEHILRSLLRQVSDLPGGPPLHRILEDRYEKRRVKGDVSAEEAAEILIDTIETRPATYIVIDALDECDRQMRDTLLDALKTILTESNSLVKIFVTSRDNHYDIALSMDGFPALCKDASRNQKDIDYYVQYSVQRAITKRKLLPTERITGDLQQAIVDSLCSGADGMFRWVELQLELLYTIRVRSILLERLKRLPPKLEEIYAELYSYKMQELGEEQAKVFKTILSWLLVAKIPLHTSEICQLVGTSDEIDNISVETVLDMTFDLVRLDAEQDQFKFSHLSVREFLEKRQAEYGQIVLQTMATCACLDFLAANNHINADSYAAHYWPYHAEDAVREGGSEKLEQQLDEFLAKNNDCFKAWNTAMFVRLFYIDENSMTSTEQRLLQSVTEKGNPLLVAACFALPKTLRTIISETDQLIRINLRNYMGETALQLVSQYGPVESAQILLEQGADVNAQGRIHGNALCAASSKGYMDTAKLLLNHGADVNAVVVTNFPACEMYTSTALYTAASNGRADIVELLLRNDADVNTRVTTKHDKHKVTALYAASNKGHEAVVKLLLLNKNVDVNSQESDDGNALCAASSRGHVSIVKLLLDNGANVNPIKRSMFSLDPLGAASVYGHEEVAKLLLYKGADVNATGSYCDTALCSAVAGGFIELVSLLLDNGADINAQGREGKALGFALRGDNPEITRLLLKRGAVDSASGEALNLASGGDIDIVRLMLEKVIDASALNKALDTAILRGRTEIVNLLLDKGAGMDTRGNFYDVNFLYAAIHGESPVEFVRFLVDNGAPINAHLGYHKNLFCTAILTGSLELVNLLLDQGADVNSQQAQHGEFRNALCFALSAKSLEIMNLLLDRGADINAHGCTLGNALQAASYTGQQEFVKLLIDRGADVNAQGGKCGNALQAASHQDRVEIVQLLLESGSDVQARSVLPQTSYRIFGSVDSDYDEPSSEVTSTALYAAASASHKHIVELLLQNDAEINTKVDAIRYDPNHSGQKISDTALWAASKRGYREIVQLLLSKGADVNVAGGFEDVYSYPFQVALYKGNQDIMCLLLDAGVDINTQELHLHGRNRSLLHTAASRGHTSIVNMLLERGVDVNAQPDGISPLKAASLEGHHEIVKILLDAGADVNFQAGRDSNALQDAASNGHLEIVKLLLDRGANIGSALHTASEGGWVEVVRLLLDKGVDVNTRKGSGDSAQHVACASMREHPNTVEILLLAGVDANARSYDQNFPLQLASARGHEKVVEILLNAGADVNAPRYEESKHHERVANQHQVGEDQDNALCAASYGGHWEVVKMLLDAGARDNCRALVAASSRDHVEVVRLLLDSGADINSKEYNPLQAALFKSCWGVMNLLLYRGADIHVQVGQHGNALQTACSLPRAKRRVIKRLLDAGAQVNAQGGRYGNALQAACASDNSYQAKIVQMLLDAGADVNARTGEHGSPLYFACLSRAERERLVRILLESGVDVNAQGGEYGNALQAASHQGHFGIVQILLNSGADINAQGGKHGNALQAALLGNHTYLAGFLRNAGAQQLEQESDIDKESGRDDATDGQEPQEGDVVDE